MTLKAYQQLIELDTLYEVVASGLGTQTLQPSLEVIVGTVDVYGSNLQPDSPPTGMFKTATAFSGINVFANVPTFLFVSQNTGTTTSIILTGISAKAVV